MKKLISLCLAVIMIFAILPVSAFAAESDNFESYDYQVALAKQVFPEYRDKLEGKSVTANAGQPRACAEKPIIAVRETRPVDDDTTMTYTEYDNGLVTLGTARFQKEADYEVTGEKAYSSYTEYTAKIVASVLDGPNFTATGVKYRIYPSAYDKVMSVGSYSIPSYSSSQFTVTRRETEKAGTTGFAYASYEFPCPVGISNYGGQVLFKVQNNNASVEFNISDERG